jgi:hypothetical protein
VVTDGGDAGNCRTEYAVAISRLEWHFTPDGFELYGIDAWDGENRVQLRAVGADGKQTATDLKLTAQGWQLKRPNGELTLGVPAAPVQANAPRSATPPTDAAAPVGH